MAAIYTRTLCCSLYFISGLTLADVVTFPNSNTIPTTSGNTARLVGVTGINNQLKTANVVIDAKDRFGNQVRLFKTAKFNTGKIRSFITTCVRNPISCTASAALSSALIYYGYTLTSDGRIILPGAAGAYQQCVEKPYPWNGDGAVVTAIGPIICATGPNWAGKYVLYTLQPQPQFPDLPYVGDLPQGVVKLNGYVYGTAIGEFAERRTYYQNWYDTQPHETAQEQLVSDEALAAMALSNPAHLQIAPGVYADLFDPIEVTETKTDEDFANEPDTELEFEYEDMITMDQVPEKVIDISGYFDWGNGWLPKQCPANKTLDIMGKSFSFDYDLLCSHISSYVAPAIRVFALFVFLQILLGGIRD